MCNLQISKMGCVEPTRKPVQAADVAAEFIPVQAGLMQMFSNVFRAYFVDVNVFILCQNGILSSAVQKQDLLCSPHFAVCFA